MFLGSRLVNAPVLRTLFRMPRQLESPEIDGPLEKILYELTTDDLRQYLKKLPGVGKPTRKAEMVSAVARRLTEGVRDRWRQLGDLERKAVAFAIHDEERRFDADRFSARYGSVPRFDNGESMRFRWEPTALGLIVIKHRGQRGVPKEIHAKLARIVPEPEPLKIAVAEEPPSTYQRFEYRRRTKSGSVGVAVEHPRAIRHEEAAARQDLSSVLRVISQGKLSASEKTRRASAASMKLLQTLLRGGDYYEWIPKKNKWEQEIGPIKAFAWPLLVQAGGLAKVSRGKLTLTRLGHSAIVARPEDTLKGLWESWLNNRLLDEFNRIDDIKGQRVRGALTRPEGRRRIISNALRECPPGEWVEFDVFSRFMVASGKWFPISDDPWKLYIGERDYGSLGYAGSRDWGILQGRYLSCLLFEYAATLGMIDVAYETPESARDDFGGIWGADEMLWLSRYDGLSHIRLNALGAYILGVTNQYAISGSSDLSLSVLPSRRIEVSGCLDLADANLLETLADREGDNVWLLNEAKLLAFLDGGGELKEFREFLARHDDQSLPESVEGLFRETERRAKACRLRGMVHLIECAESMIAETIANDSAAGKLCQRSGDRHLVVSPAKEQAFRKALKSLGYGMPVV